MPQPDLMFLLAWASHALSNEYNAALAELDISPRAYCVLVKAMTGDHTQKELAGLCDIDTTTMVVTIDELERAGLAERRPSSTDRRARIIAVTKPGERVVARGEKIVGRIQDDVLATLPARQRDAFLEGLATLVDTRLSAITPTERPARRRRAGR